MIIYYLILLDKNKDYLIDYLVNRCLDYGYVIDYNFILLFLNNVKIFKEIGDEYEEVLMYICFELIENDDFSFIGFVVKEELK